MFFYIIKQLIRNNSLARSMMNHHVFKNNPKIQGGVLDLGGAKLNEYIKILNIDKDRLKSFDLDTKNGSTYIDFEKDNLPFENNSIDNILAFNLLEHIYNHNHLVKESHRILKDNGLFIGFIPFLVNYHRDPKDFFRYTNEALEKIFKNAGFEKIKITAIGIGPFMINLNNIIFVFPKFIRPLVFLYYYLLDSIYKKFRPNITNRFPLGYYFELRK